MLEIHDTSSKYTSEYLQIQYAEKMEQFASLALDLCKHE